MMTCGHTPNGKDLETGKPICVICQCYTEVVNPNVTGRTALCSLCGLAAKSNFNLAFFEHKPNKPDDRWYCGCRGWD